MQTTTAAHDTTNLLEITPPQSWLDRLQRKQDKAEMLELKRQDTQLKREAVQLDRERNQLLKQQNEVLAAIVAALTTKGEIK